jgi:hypothetical protein
MQANKKQGKMEKTIAKQFLKVIPRHSIGFYYYYYYYLLPTKQNKHKYKQWVMNGL